MAGHYIISRLSIKTEWNGLMFLYRNLLHMIEELLKTYVKFLLFFITNVWINIQIGSFQKVCFTFKFYNLHHDFHCTGAIVSGYNNANFPTILFSSCSDDTGTDKKNVFLHSGNSCLSFCLIKVFSMSSLTTYGQCWLTKPAVKVRA